MEVETKRDHLNWLRVKNFMKGCGNQHLKMQNVKKSMVMSCLGQTIRNAMGRWVKYRKRSVLCRENGTKKCGY